MPELAATPLTFGVLGPLEVRRGDEVLAVGGPKARAVLAMLILDAGRVVSTSRLIEGVWGDDPPDGVQASLQVHISNLRKILGDGVLLTKAPGYTLDSAAAQVDHLAFDAALRAAHASRAKGDLTAAQFGLTEALAIWRGAPLADVRDAPFTEAAAPWLEERRSLAGDERIELAISMGDHRQVIAELEVALSATPHREGLWAQLMLALYRSGRQADALSAYQRARSSLLDELGIEPGADLRRLESAILVQDPALDHAPMTVPTAPDSADLAATVSAAGVRNARLVEADGTEHPLLGVVSLGRHPDCDIVLPGLLASRRHAEVRPALGGHLLIDLGSSNGTLVNGSPVVQHLLHPTDLIAIGGHELRYVAETS